MLKIFVMGKQLVKNETIVLVMNDESVVGKECFAKCGDVAFTVADTRGSRRR
jgi:hypothetical protein